MGQEAYAMFPALAEMQARSQLMRAQAGAVGQDARFAQQKYGDEQSALSAFGNAGMQGGFAGSPGGPALPGAVPMPPQPGQASQPAAGFQPFQPAPAGIRVPPAGGPAMSQAPASLPPPPSGPGTVDEVREPGDLGVERYQKAAQPPPNKWAPAPGEQHNTPDGSRPRSLDEVFAALKKANPKASPATLARAAAMYMPWLQEADQVELKRSLQENTLELGRGRIDAQKGIAELGAQTKLDIADAKNALTEQLAGQRIEAAQKRVDSVNQRMKDIAAGTLKLGQDRLEEARKSGNGRSALAAQKELRLQQEGITRLNDTYGRMIYNASFLKGDAKAAAMEEAAQFLENGMEAFRNLPDPRGEDAPPPAPPKPRRGQAPTGLQNEQHPSFEESQKLLGPQSSLMDRNTKRRRVGLPALSALS